MTYFKAVRIAMLTSCAAGWTGATAQTVAIPAGQAPTGPEIGKPATTSGAQASPLSDSNTASSSAPDAPGDIVVTGTRIVANGYQAPTPVTVVSATELLRKAPEVSPPVLPNYHSSWAPPAPT